MMNFAIIGISGYIAPRHLKAVRDTDNCLVAAADPHDSVGILDQFSFDVRYFPEIERFDRHLDKLRRGPEKDKVHYVSICTPNYLHDAHMRLALRSEADVICEKPLVINPWNLDALNVLENETGRKINTVLQLRVHPSLIELKARFDKEAAKTKHDVIITYITGRGSWYLNSWKGSEERSGGLATNIGIHFFDLLMWLFGGMQNGELHLREPKRMSGFIELKNANVKWFLSVDPNDLPYPAEAGKKATFRSITVDGQEIEFTEGFTDLHTRVYEKTINGGGFGIEDARPSIELVHKIRTSIIPVKHVFPRHSLIEKK
ncbi:MAG: Gfo/Idh/MocA family oxidoreductase [Bacteroidetes bacterium]|nr:Gfo/Idh/MocA family oxidoreductase [Bacteroidota bacterium]